MCGRFAITKPELIKAEFHLLEEVSLRPRYNIAPSQVIPIIKIGAGGSKILSMARWGLIPFWAKDIKIGYKMINARGETLAEKPAFRTAFKTRRCLVPATGFYEWKHSGEDKQPYFIRLKDVEILAFAGLWESWQKEDQAIESCTIITTTANKTAGAIHDRMPVIIDPDLYDLWLDPEPGIDKLQELIKPFSDQNMFAYPVGKGVNNPRNDISECLDKV